MKAYGYCRVSTVRQADEGTSLEVQEDKIRLWCKLHGHDLQQIFVERGVSGRNPSRKALQAALDATCKSQGVLVFYDLTRLARSLQDALAAFQRVDTAGAHLASCTEPLDSTATGRLMFQILGAFAEFTSRMNGEKVALANKRSLKENGYRTQGAQPYGWQLVNGRRVKNDDEQAVLAEMRKLSRAGKSYVSIAATLNESGHTTRGGSAWHMGSVYRVLNRKVKV